MDKKKDKEISLKYLYFYPFYSLLSLNPRSKILNKTYCFESNVSDYSWTLRLGAKVFHKYSVFIEYGPVKRKSLTMKL